MRYAYYFAMGLLLSMAAIAAPKVFEMKYSREMAAETLDPETVQFRDLRTVWHSGEPVVCGEYNAKNVFGAYTGFRKFYVKPMRDTGPLSDRVMAVHPEVPETNLLVEMACPDPNYRR